MLPGMNLKTLLSSVGINLADVEANAKRVVAEAKQELVNLHAKIDSHKLTSEKSLERLHEKMDALLRIASRESVTELITNGGSDNGNNRNANGNGNAARIASDASATNGGK